MNINSLVQFNLNPKISGKKLIVVGLEEFPYNKFKKRIREIKTSYSANRGKIDPEMLQNFRNDYKINPTDIIIYGNTDITEDMASKLMPKLPNGNYKCFAIPSSNHITNRVTNEILIGHDSAVMAWNCLITLLGRPKYVILYATNRDIYDDIHE